MTADASPLQRLHEHASAWNVHLEESFETATSLIAFGRRDAQPVVLKIVKRRNDDEWNVGAVLDAFDGAGVVRVPEHVEGAALMERITPANPLVHLSLNGRDEEATEIIASVIERMSPRMPRISVPTAQDWARGFGRHQTSGSGQLSRSLVSRAQHVYESLCVSQRDPRLCHGDLQHYNILNDERRGWLAIDPKGVIAEREYEIGAALRNPVEQPALFTDRSTLERRVDHFASRLRLDRKRILEWAFAQAVLSAIWEVEDGGNVDENHPGLMLARVAEELITVHER
jgi:streptomycin 6-kinase